MLAFERLLKEEGEEKAKKQLRTIFGSSYLWNVWSGYAQIWYVDY